MFNFLKYLNIFYYIDKMQKKRQERNFIKIKNDLINMKSCPWSRMCSKVDKSNFEKIEKEINHSSRTGNIDNVQFIILTTLFDEIINFKDQEVKDFNDKWKNQESYDYSDSCGSYYGDDSICSSDYSSSSSYSSSSYDSISSSSSSSD